MAKKVVGLIKLQVPAGKANPSPPIGPALGQRGLNIMEFCKAFNAQTQKMEPGLPVPVVITAYHDKSFTFVMKTPPASVLIRKAAGARRRDILGQFLVESVAITGAGSAVGAAIGLAGAFAVTAVMRARTEALVYAAFTWGTVLVAMVLLLVHAPVRSSGPDEALKELGFRLARGDISPEEFERARALIVTGKHDGRR